MLPSPETVALICVSLAFILKLVNLVPPRMSLVLFELLPLLWSSEQVDL